MKDLELTIGILSEVLVTAERICALACHPYLPYYEHRGNPLDELSLREKIVSKSCLTEGS